MSTLSFNAAYAPQPGNCAGHTTYVNTVDTIRAGANVPRLSEHPASL